MSIIRFPYKMEDKICPNCGSDRTNVQDAGMREMGRPAELYDAECYNCGLAWVVVGKKENLSESYLATMTSTSADNILARQMHGVDDE